MVKNKRAQRMNNKKCDVSLSKSEQVFFKLPNSIMALVSSKKKDLNLSSYSRLNLKLLKINLKSTENRKFKKLTLFNYVPISPCFFFFLNNLQKYY